MKCRKNLPDWNEKNLSLEIYPYLKPTQVRRQRILRRRDKASEGTRQNALVSSTRKEGVYGCIGMDNTVLIWIDTVTKVGASTVY